MTIRPDENEIRGAWIIRNGRAEADQTCRRIEQLLEYLREAGRDSSGWDVLYVDPSDGRYWELIYPDSQLHGGGPPTLRNLSEAAARKKYGI
jgi:hypothetical protein